MESPYFKTRFPFNEKRKTVWGILVPYLQRQFPMGDKILDLGCGYGEFINHIQGANRFALDTHWDVSHFLDPGVAFRQIHLPARLTLFDIKMTTIFASNLLEHLDRTELNQLFTFIREALEPGGLFISLTPNFKRAAPFYFDDYTHLTPLTEVGLSDWLQSKGFEITYCHPGFMPLTLTNGKLPIHPLIIKLWLASPWKPGGKQMLIVAKNPNNSNNKPLALN